VSGSGSYFSRFDIRVSGSGFQNLLLLRLENFALLFGVCGLEIRVWGAGFRV